MKDIIKMIVVLSAICCIAGLALANLKVVTAPLIEQQVLTYVQGPAVKYIFQDAEEQPIYDADPLQNLKKFDLADGTQVTVFPALKDGKLVALALENYGTGFGGDVGVMVGFQPSGEALAGIGITTLKETPGLGMRVQEKGYTAQFRGMAVGSAKVKADGGDVDAISGATISSRATTLAIENAAKVFAQIKDDVAKAW